MRRKITTDQYAEEERWVFSFDLKDESKEECLTGRGRVSQITRSFCRSQEHGRSEYPRLSEKSGKESIETKQLREAVPETVCKQMKLILY